MVYVDNINVVAANPADITDFKERLFNTFKITVEDKSYFLGINIKRSKASLRLY
jgi:hypothetical protein